MVSVKAFSFLLFSGVVAVNAQTTAPANPAGGIVSQIESCVDTTLLAPLIVAITTDQGIIDLVNAVSGALTGNGTLKAISHNDTMDICSAMAPPSGKIVAALKSADLVNAVFNCKHCNCSLPLPIPLSAIPQTLGYASANDLINTAFRVIDELTQIGCDTTSTNNQLCGDVIASSLSTLNPNDVFNYTTSTTCSSVQPTVTALGCCYQPISVLARDLGTVLSKISVLLSQVGGVIGLDKNVTAQFAALVTGMSNFPTSCTYSNTCTPPPSVYNFLTGNGSTGSNDSTTTAAPTTPKATSAAVSVVAGSSVLAVAVAAVAML